MNQNNDNGGLPRPGMPYSDADDAYIDNLVADATRRAIAGAPQRAAARSRSARRRWLTAAAAAVVALVATLAVTLTGSMETAATGDLLAQATGADSTRDEFGFSTIDYTEAEAAEVAADPGPIDEFINTLDDTDAAMLAALEAELDIYDYDNYI